MSMLSARLVVAHRFVRKVPPWSEGVEMAGERWKLSKVWMWS